MVSLRPIILESSPNAGPLASISELVEADRLRPRVGKVLPLSEVRETLALSEIGRAGGKIVLRIAG